MTEEMVRPTLFMVGCGAHNLGAFGPVAQELGFELYAVNLRSRAPVDGLNALPFYRVLDTPPYGGTDVNLAGAFYDPLEPEHESSIRRLRKPSAAVEKAARAWMINCGLGSDHQAVTAAAQFLRNVLRYRLQTGIGSPLVITSSDNPSGETFAIHIIETRLLSLLYELPPFQRDAISNDLRQNVRFVPCVSDRICTHRILPDRPGLPVQVVAERHRQITFDEALLAVSPLLPWVSDKAGRSIRFSNNLERERQQKIYLFSAPQALAAVLAVHHPSRPRTLPDALQISGVRMFIREAMDDIVQSLHVATGVDQAHLNHLADLHLRRIAAMPDEPVRILRDLPRKLGRSDRFLGPLLHVLRYRHKLSSPLVQGVVLALQHARKCAEEKTGPNRDLGLLLLHQEGVRQVLVDLGGLRPDDPREGLLIGEIEAKTDPIRGVRKIIVNR